MIACEVYALTKPEQGLTVWGNAPQYSGDLLHPQGSSGTHQAVESRTQHLQASQLPELPATRS